MGGINHKDIVCRMLEALWSNPLARCFNWSGTGANEKQRIKGTKLHCAVQGIFIKIMYIEDNYLIMFLRYAIAYYLV